MTGTLPYDRRVTRPLELTTRVERERPELPSAAARRAIESDRIDGTQRWVRRLRGDLDTITIRASARDPERRYPSAAALAADLRRYLVSKPVEARPDSRRYRMGKFASRHRLGVAASSCTSTAVREALPRLEEAYAIRRPKPPASPGDFTDLEAALAATRAALR